MNIKKLTTTAILSALYVVLALSLKIPMGVGNISLDLGYIVLTIAALNLGAPAAIVGGLGALLESMLFSSYGISYGWIVMNVIIGLICGIVLNKMNKKDFTIKNYIIASIIIIASVFIGVAAKTGIECYLYSIPLIVKIPKSLTAFVIDSVVMIIGLPIGTKIKKIFK